ncbi:MAG: hypothetical protein WED07_12975 [Candidatus Freyarchaeum deiterrae]
MPITRLNNNPVRAKVLADGGLKGYVKTRVALSRRLHFTGLINDK